MLSKLPRRHITSQPGIFSELAQAPAHKDAGDDSDVSETLQQQLTIVGLESRTVNVEWVSIDGVAPSITQKHSIVDVREALPTRALTDVTFVESVDRSDQTLVAQICSIAEEAFEEGEAVMQLKKGGRIAAVLLNGEVAGYAVYVVRRELLSLSICKLAVAQCHRRRGLGRVIIRNLIQIAKRRSRGQAALEAVCLSALPTAVRFYKACGFYEDASLFQVRPDASECGFIEGQVYMEYRIRRKLPKT